MKYARCPRCWRMDLSRWSLEDYHVGSFTRLMLRFGGHPYRCEYCRVNFVSFRKRKDRYRSKHRRHGSRPSHTLAGGVLSGR